MHRLALLGCGDVAVRDYLPELHRLSGRVELVAVCSRSADRARAVAERFGAATWYSDYRRMLAECDADLVANLTPIQVHAETTMAALRSGRHVYSEKPLASTVREARALAEVAGRGNLLLVCAPCVLLFPQVRRARALLEEGVIGPVTSARGQGHGGVPPWHGYASDPSPFFARGGGPALDMGVYPLHALTGLLGPAQRVTALTSRTRHSFLVDDGQFAGTHIPIEVDDNWHLLVAFGGGLLASVEASNCVRATRAPQLELMGLEGTIALNLLDEAAPLSVLRTGGDWEEVTVSHARSSGPDHVLGIEHLLDCLDSGAPPLLSAEQAIHVLEIVEQAEAAAHDGQTRSLQTGWRSPR
jgi:predicted dehydrogenase